jgi:hypothetical protein
VGIEHVLSRIDEDVVWAVLIVSVLLVVALGLVRYAGYLDKDDLTE